MSEFFDSLNFAGGAGYGEASFSQVGATRSGSSSAIAAGSRSNSVSGVNTTPGTFAPGRIPGSAGGSGGSAAALAPPPQSQAIVFWKHASPSPGSQFAASLRNRGAGPATRGGKGQLGYTSPASAKHASALSPSPLANLDTTRSRRYDDESPLGAERELANQARARSAKSAGKRKADGLGDEDGMDLDSPLKPGASRAQSLKAGSEASGSSSSAGAAGASTAKRATHRARTMKRSRTSRISAAVPWADPNTSIDTSFDMSSDSLLANTTIGAAGTAAGAGGAKAGASDPAQFIAYVNAHLFKGLDDTSQDPPRADVPPGMATATRSGGARVEGGSGRSTRAGTAPPEPVEDRQGEPRDGRQSRGDRETRSKAGGVNIRKDGSAEEETGSSSSGMQPRNSSWNRHHTDPSPKINRSPIRKLTTKPTPAAAPVSPAKSASPKRASAAKAAPAVKAAPTEARTALGATTPASRSTTKSPSPQKAAPATNGSMARLASNASINTRVASSRAAPQAGNTSHKNRSPTPPASNAGPSARPPIVKTLGSTARRTPSSASAPFRAPSTSGSSNATHNSGLSAARTPLHTKRPSPGTTAPLRTVSTSPKRGSTPAKAIVIDDDDDDDEGAGSKRGAAGAADDGMGDDSFDFGDDADFATISDMLADQGI